MLYNKDWDRVPSNPVSDLLMKAAGLIEKHGHTKGQLKDKNGSMCFMGAIWQETSQIDLGLEAAKTTAMALGLGFDSHYKMGPSSALWTMVEWNNAPERTAQEVIDAMRLAAKTYQNA